MIRIDKTSVIIQELKEQLLTTDDIINSYCYTQGLTPLDILVQKEKMLAVIILYRAMAKVLKPDELEDMVRYIIEKRSRRDIGARKNEIMEDVTSKQKKRMYLAAKLRGYRRISRILKKLRKNVPTGRYIGCKELLLPNESNKEADTPKFHVGWLCTSLEKIYAGGDWTTNRKSYNNREIYQSKTRCMIPEYIQSSFPDSPKGSIACYRCGEKCTRKSMFNLDHVKTYKIDNNNNNEKDDDILI